MPPYWNCLHLKLGKFIFMKLASTVTEIYPRRTHMSVTMVFMMKNSSLHSPHSLGTLTVEKSPRMRRRIHHPNRPKRKYEEVAHFLEHALSSGSAYQRVRLCVPSPTSRDCSHGSTAECKRHNFISFFRNSRSYRTFPVGIGIHLDSPRSTAHLPGSKP